MTPEQRKDHGRRGGLLSAQARDVDRRARVEQTRGALSDREWIEWKAGHATGYSAGQGVRSRAVAADGLPTVARSAPPLCECGAEKSRGAAACPRCLALEGRA